jgi:hypothetical protein
MLAKLSRVLNGFQSGFTFTNPSYLAPHRQEVIVKRYLNSLSSSQLETPAQPETVLRPIDNDAWKPLHTPIQIDQQTGPFLRDNPF